MRTILILVLFGLTSRGFSQNAVLSLTSIDTTCAISLQITPKGQGAYVYGYSAKVDTLYFASAINGEQEMHVRIPVDTKLKAALFELIVAFNSIKIDSKHRSTYQSCAVIGTIFCKANERQVTLTDKYYVSKVLPILTKFSELLSPKMKFAKFDCQPTKEPPDSNTYLQIGLNHTNGFNQPRNKVFTPDLARVGSYQVLYYDTLIKQLNFYRATKFDIKPERAVLNSKCLAYVNSFSALNNIPIRISDVGERFVVEYSSSGIHIKTTISSLDIVYKEKKCTDLLNYVNSKLGKKYQLD